jgi:hypothetical protein
MRRLRGRAVFAVILLAAVVLGILISAVYCRNSRISRIASITLEIDEGILRYLPNRSMEVGCRNPLWWSVSRSNEEGFRDEMLGSGRDFIGVFGDSYVLGDCLKDGETIDSQLERELRKEGRDYKVYNFGIRGYNLNSSLRALDEMSRRYSIRYAIVYFLPDDDMLGCDISCQYAMQRDDATGYARFMDNASRDYEAAHSGYKSLIKKGFENLIRSQIVERGVLNRTRVVFYVSGTDDESRQLIGDVLERYNISYLSRKDFKECQGLLRPCEVWLDGHPSAFLNGLMAGQLSDYIMGIEAPGYAKGSER